MKFPRRAALAALFCGAMLLLVSAQAMSQQAAQPATSTQPGTGEKTVEEAYLQSSLETMIIREEAESDTRDMKQLALQYAKQAIDAGRKNDDIRNSLAYLATETINISARPAGVGPITNNFPDIRRTACDYLGEFPSQDTKKTLIKVVLGDNEPMVIGAAIRSLGKIGLNDGDEVTQDIAFVVNRFDIIGPDNSLAFECLVAIQRLADKNNGLKDPDAIRAVMRIATGNYITPVKAMANQVLDSLRHYQASSGSK